MPADAQPTDLSGRELSTRIAELAPWFHNIDLNGTPTAPDHFLGNYPADKFARFSQIFPADLTGKSVLDIGCNAGFYSVEALRRGASRVVGIDSDALYPVELQREVAFCMPNALLHTLASPHGHDSFLIEIKELNRTVCGWLAGTYFGERVTSGSLLGKDSRDWARLMGDAPQGLNEEGPRRVGIFL